MYIRPFHESVEVRLHMVGGQNSVTKGESIENVICIKARVRHLLYFDCIIVRNTLPSPTKQARFSNSRRFPITLQLVYTYVHKWFGHCKVRRRDVLQLISHNFSDFTFTSRFVNKASDWSLNKNKPIRGFVYKPACEFQYELLNFTTKYGTKFATFTEKLCEINCIITGSTNHIFAHNLQV